MPRSQRRTRTPSRSSTRRAGNRPTTRAPTSRIVDGSTIVGVVGFHPIDRANRSVNVGDRLDERRQGSGIATRAARAACRHAFRSWALNWGRDQGCDREHPLRRSWPSVCPSPGRATSARPRSSTVWPSILPSTRCLPARAGSRPAAAARRRELRERALDALGEHREVGRRHAVGVEAEDHLAGVADDRDADRWPANSGTSGRTSTSGAPNA